MKNILKHLSAGSISLVLLLLIIFTSNEKACSAQDTIVLQVFYDNTLYEDAGGLISNGRGKYLFAGKGDNNLTRRALIHFLTGEFVPYCSKVLSVDLKVHLSGGNPANKTIELRKMLDYWGQGDSDAPGLEENGTSAGDYDATWLDKYHNANDFWANPGGDYSGIISNSITVGGPGYYYFNSTPQMVADFQSWIDDTNSEFGWILLGDESSDSTAKRFHSRDADTSEFRPEVKLIIETPDFYLYMESLIEGFWDGTDMVEDLITVKLRNPVSPFNVIDSSSRVAGQYGATYCFNAPPGDYYISVHHRNTIETWSSAPINFALNGFEYYTFKDAVTKAYGDNQVFKFSEFCFYSGDVDQNGLVDATDLLNIFNDANTFTTGYVPTDVTGNDLVDVTDLLIAFNNANSFVSVIRP